MKEKNLLNYIIREHLKTGQPVGSDLLVERYGLKFSPATIRNKMADLENEGYLTHPYTSAGRIPTEKGYYFYLENFLKDEEPDERIKIILKKIRQQFKKSPTSLLKEIAKILAEVSKETVLVASAPDDVYFTGLANLFNQPEFKELNLIHNLSQVIDHFDEQMEDIFDQIDEQIKIFVGHKNPFSNKCTTIITRYHFPKGSKGVIGILGPMRMDYDYNLALLKYIKELISNNE